MYLTPNRFRTMGVGSDLTGVEDWELRTILVAASNVVDSYCNVPLLPNRYSFRGGTMTNEEHTFGPDSRRIRLRARPIRTVESLRIYATSTQYLDVNPTRIYIEDEEGWVEVVEAGLTSIGLWGAAMMPMIGLEELIARTTYTYGWRFTETGGYLASIDGTFTTYSALNQFWDNTQPVTVYVNAVQRTSGFTIDHDEGSVTFTPALTANDIVTADYVYTLPSEISRATALIAGAALAERDLMAKGLGQLAEIAVEEVRLRRDARKTGTVVAAGAMPDAAIMLLDGFRFISVR